MVNKGIWSNARDTLERQITSSGSSRTVIRRLGDITAIESSCCEGISYLHQAEKSSEQEHHLDDSERSECAKQIMMLVLSDMFEKLLHFC